MVRVSQEEVDDAWRKIANAVDAGHLGCGAKVNTALPYFCSDFSACFITKTAKLLHIRLFAGPRTRLRSMQWFKAMLQYSFAFIAKTSIMNPI